MLDNKIKFIEMKNQTKKRDPKEVVYDILQEKKEGDVVYAVDGFFIRSIRLEFLLLFCYLFYYGMFGICFYYFREGNQSYLNFIFNHFIGLWGLIFFVIVVNINSTSREIKEKFLYVKYKLILMSKIKKENFFNKVVILNIYVLLLSIFNFFFDFVS